MPAGWRDWKCRGPLNVMPWPRPLTLPLSPGRLCPEAAAVPGLYLHTTFRLSNSSAQENANHILEPDNTSLMGGPLAININVSLY